jgi:XTP/dITP diphosphohydrolase
VKLLAATRSPGKQREIRRILAGSGIEAVFPDEIGLAELPAEAALESDESYEANARRKAEFFARLSSLPTFADDSGLEVFALGGAPGVRSRRWAGASGTDQQVEAANNAELVKRLAGTPPARRLARYRCVVVYLHSSSGVPTICQGDCTGRILEESRGTEGFGYDPYFLSDELGKTFGEVTPREKDTVSHRGRALRALAQTLLARSEP